MRAASVEIAHRSQDLSKRQVRKPSLRSGRGLRRAPPVQARACHWGSAKLGLTRVAKKRSPKSGQRTHSDANPVRSSLRQTNPHERPCMLTPATRLPHMRIQHNRKAPQPSDLTSQSVWALSDRFATDRCECWARLARQRHPPPSLALSWNGARIGDSLGPIVPTVSPGDGPPRALRDAAWELRCLGGALQRKSTKGSQMAGSRSMLRKFGRKLFNYASSTPDFHRPLRFTSAGVRRWCGAGTRSGSSWLGAGGWVALPARTVARKPIREVANRFGRKA